MPVGKGGGCKFVIDLGGDIQSNKGILVGDRGLVTWLWVVAAVGIEFSWEEGSPDTMMEFEVIPTMLLL